MGGNPSGSLASWVFLGLSADDTHRTGSDLEGPARARNGLEWHCCLFDFFEHRMYRYRDQDAYTASWQGGRHMMQTGYVKEPSGQPGYPAPRTVTKNNAVPVQYTITCTYLTPPSPWPATVHTSPKTSTLIPEFLKSTGGRKSLLRRPHAAGGDGMDGVRPAEPNPRASIASQGIGFGAGGPRTAVGLSYALLPRRSFPPSQSSLPSHFF